MNMNLECFAFVVLSIILCDTSKASENLTFVFEQSLILSSVLLSLLSVVRCHEDSVEQIPFKFISFDVREEISVTFDPKVDLNFYAVGRSNYMRFYSVLSPIMRQKI